MKPGFVRCSGESSYRHTIDYFCCQSCCGYCHLWSAVARCLCWANGWLTPSHWACGLRKTWRQTYACRQTTSFSIWNYSPGLVCFVGQGLEFVSAVGDPDALIVCRCWPHSESWQQYYCLVGEHLIGRLFWESHRLALNWFSFVTSTPGSGDEEALRYSWLPSCCKFQHHPARHFHFYLTREARASEASQKSLLLPFLSVRYETNRYLRPYRLIWLVRNWTASFGSY